ncbi:MAG: glycosyltransferase family 39 protein [Bacteroidota bacterium]
MRNKISQAWDDQPLRIILLLAIIIRLLAVFFSKGFGWFDDHFLIIEASQSWVDGEDYNNWLPGSENNAGPTGHNLFYTGLHFLFFKLCSLLNFSDPQGKMYVIRLLHAGLSLMVVFFGYKLANYLGDKKAARSTGLLLAILWFFPFLSVRNLVEFTSVPFLLWGTWILINDTRQRPRLLNGLLAGIILGLAFCMRFQTLIYLGGIGLGLLVLGRWKEAFGAGAGIVMTAFLFLGSIDIYLWGYPFAELIEYVRYNMFNYGEYISGPWYQYFLVILGILVPPLSFYLFFGFFYEFIKNRRQTLLIFLPVIIFLAFHSYFPNKQERFILPLIPFIILLGMLGWQHFLEGSGFWKRRKKLLSTSMVFFWIINIVMLMIISTTYSKRARVESMTYLSRYEGISKIMVENTNQYNTNLLPMYYLGQRAKYTEITKSRPISDITSWYVGKPHTHPDFFIFEGEKNIRERVALLKDVFPEMEFETKISPGFIDRILFWLNPVNENQNAYIYRNTQRHPHKIE